VEDLPWQSQDQWALAAFNNPSQPHLGTLPSPRPAAPFKLGPGGACGSCWSSLSCPLLAWYCGLGLWVLAPRPLGSSRPGTRMCDGGWCCACADVWSCSFETDLLVWAVHCRFSNQWQLVYVNVCVFTVCCLIIVRRL